MCSPYITGAGLVTPGVDRQLSYLVPESERPRGIGDALSSNTLQKIKKTN